MSSSPTLMLDHISLPARRPEWLADWYAERFGLRSQAGFVLGAGVLLRFEIGEPVDYRGRPHFGFRCDSRATVLQWARQLDQQTEETSDYCGFKAADPEGNLFEVYFEQPQAQR